MQRSSFTAAAAALVLALSVAPAMAVPAAATAAQEAMAAAPAAPSAGVVTCAAFASTLRHGSDPFRTLMQTSSAISTAANQQSIRYLAVRPSAAAAGYPTVVFFNGSSQVTPDWPAAMLVSASGALCNHAALVFFDYPGVGGTGYPGNDAFTYDQVAADVYGLLASLKAGGALDVTRVDLAGWSLGTEAALKFAVLAAGNRSFKASGMSLGSLFLIAPKTGGDLESSTAPTPQPCGTAGAAPAAALAQSVQEPPPGAGRAAATFYPATGNQAMCATAILDQLQVQADYDEGLELGGAFTGLLFPYAYEAPAGSVQTAYGAGNPPTVCAATVSGAALSALCNLAAGRPIETQCRADATSACAATLALLAANREQQPYAPGLPYDAFYGERAMLFHFDYASCSSASATAWQSTGCTFNPHQTGDPRYDPDMVVDGSPCLTEQTVSADASPTIQGCPGLAGAALAQVRFYVWNGQEDLVIRHDYGQALCTWLARNGHACTYRAFANAGHGVLYSDAATLYAQLVAALAATPAAPNGAE